MGVDGLNSHVQTWVKVNAPVDQGIAEVVSILSEVEGLQTVESCQGEPVRDHLDRDVLGFVFFYLGDWRTISEFAFGTIAPALGGIGGATITVEMFGGSDPMGKLGVLAPEIPKLAAALRQAICRNSPCSHDTECTALRSY